MAQATKYIAVLGFLLACCGQGCSRPQAQASNKPAPQGTAKPAVQQAPPTPIATQKSELGQPAWDPAWDRYVEEALQPAMLSTEVPRDVRQFCPRFYQMSSLDKKAFWAYFFQALAGTEAGLDPDTRVRHTEPAVAVKDDVTGRQVRSEGLLQLTYEDAERYGCDFDWQKDKALPAKDPAKTILQPKNNLECGVKILSRQILDQHKGVLSRSSYWSPLQPGTVPYRNFVKQMQNAPAACAQHAPRTRRPVEASR